MSPKRKKENPSFKDSRFLPAEQAKISMVFNNKWRHWCKVILAQPGVYAWYNKNPFGVKSGGAVGFD